MTKTEQLDRALTTFVTESGCTTDQRPPTMRSIRRALDLPTVAHAEAMVLGLEHAGLVRVDPRLPKRGGQNRVLTERGRARLSELYDEVAT